MLIPDQPLIRKHSYFFTQYHAVMTLTSDMNAPGWGYGSKSRASQIFFIMDSLVFEQQLLCRVDSLWDLGPKGLVPSGWGKGSKSRRS